NSQQNELRDEAGPAVKYSVPMVVNGKVYVGTQTELTVYGRLSAVASLALSPSVVAGGTSSVGTVNLNFLAPAGGLTLELSSSNPVVAGVPTSVTVPEVASSANFTVTTNAVTSSTQVVISASFQGVIRTVTLGVGPWLSSLMVPSPLTISTISNGVVQLIAPAP